MIVSGVWSWVVGSKWGNSLGVQPSSSGRWLLWQLPRVILRMKDVRTNTVSAVGSGAFQPHRTIGHVTRPVRQCQTARFDTHNVVISSQESKWLGYDRAVIHTSVSEIIPRELLPKSVWEEETFPIVKENIETLSDPECPSTLTSRCRPLLLVLYFPDPRQLWLTPAFQLL